jgi:hypothetical protein
VEVQGVKCDMSNILIVLIPGKSQKGSAGFVRLRRTTRLPTDNVMVGPSRFAPLVRAIGDTARDMQRFGDVQTLVCRAIQLGRCSPDELAREVEEGPVPGSRLLRNAIDQVRAGIWSAPEGDLKRLIDRSNLEKPIYNPMLYASDGSFVGCPDAWWERAGVAAEVDSYQYHFEAKGYAATADKHNRMTVAGITVLHLLPSKIRSQGPEVISDLRLMIRDGHQRPRLHIRTVRTSPQRR